MDPIIIIFYGALLVVIWFFFIRPQSKKAKEQANFINQLEKGAKVVTSGGIHGKILKIEDNGSVLLEIDNNVKMRVERSAISMELTGSVYGQGDKKAETAEAK